MSDSARIKSAEWLRFAREDFEQAERIVEQATYVPRHAACGLAGAASG